MEDARGGKRKLAQALTRVVSRDGIAGVSVRSVAAEAGVSGGTVQHHFPTRAEMIRFAMEWTSTQVEQRLANVSRWGEVRDWTREILLELLPLDAGRRREHAVWLAFVAHAATDPALTDLKRRTNARLLELYTRIVRARRGLPIPAVDATLGHDDAELQAVAALLQAMLDGLSLQLAELTLEEAGHVGPELLDRFLALAVDTPAARPGSHE